MSDDVYSKFQDAGVLNTVERPDPDNWVLRQGKPGRKLVTGDLTIEGTEGGGQMSAAEILSALLTVDSNNSGLNANFLQGVPAASLVLQSVYAADQASLEAMLDLLAPKAGPVFTGDVIVPTQPLGTSNGTAASMAALAEAIAAIEGGGGSVGGFLPVLRPEAYGISGSEPDANAELVSEAFDAMIAETISQGGAIWFLKGNYPINRPISIPSNTHLIGLVRGEGVTGPSTIRGVQGNHDLLDFAYGVENFFCANMNFGHGTSVTPTAGCAWDARWLANFLCVNLSFFNCYNGIDFGVARSGILQDFYMRGFTGTTSGMGTDAPSPGDCGFGILFRSTQTLLDGNVGKETQFYDRDGSGVTVQPKSKGTSVKLRGGFINGKQVGEDDSEEESLAEEYSPNFICLWSYGASTIRCESLQLRQGENAIRLQHAPNRSGTNRDGGETGKQMCAGNFFFNISAEANKRTYDFGGFEKLYAILVQANGVSTNGFAIGDNVGGTYPGVTAGISPTDEWGGAGTFLLCNALTCREEGFVIWSGAVRLIEPQVAGYSGNGDGDIDPGNGVALAATTTSSRYALNGSSNGTFNVVNKSQTTAFKFTIGGGAVTEDNGSPSGDKDSITVPAGGFAQFNRDNPGSQTHIAVRTASGTATGEAGKQANLNSVGILIKPDAGRWPITIRGGVVSKDKSLHTAAPNSQQYAIKIQNGANNFYISDVDVREGGISNESTGATSAVIRNLIRSAYSFTTYPTIHLNTTSSTSYTLAMRDNGNGLITSNSGTKTVTLPANATVALPIGTRVEIINTGLGDLTVSGAGGTTVYSANNTAQRGQSVTCYKVDTNTWVVTR